MIYRFITVLILLSTSSCIPYNDLILFRKGEKPLTELPTASVNKNVDVPIQPNDALSITVSCLDPQLALPFNLVDTHVAG